MAWLEVLTIFFQPGRKQVESLVFPGPEQTGLTEPSLVHGGLGNQNGLVGSLDHFAFSSPGESKLKV